MNILRAQYTLDANLKEANLQLEITSLIIDLFSLSLFIDCLLLNLNFHFY